MAQMLKNLVMQLAADMWRGVIVEKALAEHAIW